MEAHRRLMNFDQGIHSIHEIDVLSASKLFRLKINDEPYIYKEFTEKSGNELEVYELIRQNIRVNIPRVIKIYTESPKGMIMEDLGVPLKRVGLNSSEKQSLLYQAVQSLSMIHSSGKMHSERLLSMDSRREYVDISNWSVWTLPMLQNLLKKNLSWFDEESISTLRKIHSEFQRRFPEPSDEKTFNHGDPHLDNIFYKDDEIYFIDWEWSCVSSPLRDFTLFIQDVQKIHLIKELKNFYAKSLREQGYEIKRHKFDNDFNYYLCDNTMKMISWNIEKFLKGFITQDALKEFLMSKERILNHFLK